jgi:hypothetical protein
MSAALSIETLPPPHDCHIMGIVPDTLYDLTKTEMRAAVKAFRRLPLGERRKAFRSASHGEPHPDPAVAVVAEQWARAVLRRAWWNRVPSWTQPTACVVVMLTGWWLGAGVVVIPAGGIAFMIGLAEWSNRRVARQMLMAATPDSSAGSSIAG